MENYIKAFKAISIITLFSILNFVLTIFLQVILAWAFGAKMEMDAYLLAVAIPIVVISLIANASEVVFVPFLKDIGLTDSQSNLDKLEIIIFNFFFLALPVISILGILLAPNIIKYLAPGFSPEAKKLAIILFTIMIPSIIFGGLSGLMISIYHSREKFARPSFVIMAHNLIIIFTFFLLYPVLKIKALALGMLLGYIGQFLLLFPIMFKEKRYSFYFNLKEHKLYKVGKRFLQILVGGGILGLIIPFERLLASRLPEGSISYLGYANKIISLFLLLPTAAIPIVLLPNLSRHFTTQNLDKLRHNLSLGIRLVFFIIFPISVLLVILRTDLVYILLERGNFDRLATQGVATALICYSALLLGVGLAAITGRGFFAMRNTFIPAAIMSISFLFYILIAIPLSKLFSFVGLALSLSITVLTGLAVDLLILRRMLNGIEGKAILTTVYKVFISSLIMGAVAWFLYKNLTTSFVLENKFFLFLKLGISVLISLGVYAIFCFLLKVEELTIIYNTVFATLVKKK